MSIYRFVNFFDLYNLLVHKNLRFHRVSELEDSNEGLAIIFRSLYWLPVTDDDEQRIKTDYGRRKKLAYLSCWCKEADKTAMWRIYSRDKTSFRIKSSKEKLTSTIHEYWKQYSDQIHGYSPNNKDVLDVKYYDLKKMMTDLKKRYKSNKKELAKMRENNPNGIFWVVAHKILDSPEYRGTNPWAIKDDAYDYEREVRAIIHFNLRFD